MKFVSLDQCNNIIDKYLSDCDEEEESEKINLLKLVKKEIDNLTPYEVKLSSIS